MSRDRRRDGVKKLTGYLSEDTELIVATSAPFGDLANGEEIEVLLARTIDPDLQLLFDRNIDGSGCCSSPAGFKSNGNSYCESSRDGEGNACTTS